MSLTKSLILLLSLSITSACGLKPVHAKMDSSLSSELASVQIGAVNSVVDNHVSNNTGPRDSQVLKYKLAELLAPDGQGSYPSYRLDINLLIEKAELGIQEDLRVTRYDIIETAEYNLVSLANNQVIHSGKARIKSSFNRTASEFSTFVAEEDASEKAAEELAQEIKQRLTAFFASKS